VTRTAVSASGRPDVGGDTEHEWAGWDLTGWARVCVIRDGGETEWNIALRDGFIARTVTPTDLIYFGNALVDLGTRSLDREDPQ
jgi:hypothetical protein